MTGLIIKDGYSIQTPRCQAFMFEHIAGVVDPDGFAEGFGDFLFFVGICHSSW